MWLSWWQGAWEYDDGTVVIQWSFNGHTVVIRGLIKEIYSLVSVRPKPYGRAHEMSSLRLRNEWKLHVKCIDVKKKRKKLLTQVENFGSKIHKKHQI